MGTRGCYGFRKNGIDKLTYNHYDSDPDYRGKIMVTFCKETSLDEMNEIYDRLILVNENDKPTQEQIEECKRYYNGDVSCKTPEDWYCLLRNAQGEPNEYKNGLRYMIDNHDFIKDSLWCEYAYIINLDTEELEFWVGGQDKPDIYNRYGVKRNEDYYPCKMVASYPLVTISLNEYSVRDFVDDMKKAEKEAK